jgi:capsular polysaccharide transport system permease protein
MPSLQKTGAQGSALDALPKRSLQAAQRAVELSAALQRRIGWFGVSFLIFVIVPTFLTLLYLTFLASDQYESEARFVVRSGDTSGPSMQDHLSGLGSLTALTGIKSTAQDAFIVTDYIRSRTIIEDLGGKAKAYEFFAPRGADLLSRLRANKSLEDVLLYWRRQVTASIDTQSNVITLRAVAFSPEDAKKLTEQIVQKSESLVNDISVRNRADAYARAEIEVQRALQRLATMRVALLSFRTKASTIDPLLSATSIGETLTLLTREKIALEANRVSLKGVLDANAPSIRFITSQIESLERQIEELQSRLTGRVKGLETSAAQLADYEDLKLQSMFAEKLLEIAQSGLDRARLEVEKQQLYLMLVVKPTMPEEARYPRPIVGSLMIFALCIVIWSMISLIIASIYDHAN